MLILNYYEIAFLVNQDNFQKIFYNRLGKFSNEENFLSRREVFFLNFEFFFFL